MAEPAPPQVLLVDDDRDVRDALRSMLEEIGVQDLTEAMDGEQALSEMEQTRFDLVLLDINLPLVGGQGVLARIARGDGVLQPAYVAVISGAERLNQSRDLLHMIGADSLLAKPFHLADIERIFNEAMDGQG